MYVWPSPLALSWRPSAYVMYVYKSSARNWLPHVCIVTMDPSVTRCNCGYWEVKTGDLSTLGEHVCLLILLTCFHFLLSDNACIVPSSHSKLRDPSVWGSQEERTGEVLDANSGTIGSQVSTYLMDIQMCAFSFTVWQQFSMWSYVPAGWAFFVCFFRFHATMLCCFPRAKMRKVVLTVFKGDWPHNIFQ